MKNYYFHALNPITRSTIIKRLKEKGYCLNEQEGVDSKVGLNLVRDFPSEEYPIILLHRYVGRSFITIDVISYDRLSFLMDVVDEEFHLSSLAKIDQIPDADPFYYDFPVASKYELTYQKFPGVVFQYTVSNPVEETKTSITCWAFGKGMRTFKRDQIVWVNKLS